MEAAENWQPLFDFGWENTSDMKNDVRLSRWKIVATYVTIKERLLKWKVHSNGAKEG